MTSNASVIERADTQGWATHLAMRARSPSAALARRVAGYVSGDEALWLRCAELTYGDLTVMTSCGRRLGVVDSREYTLTPSDEVAMSANV